MIKPKTRLFLLSLLLLLSLVGFAQDINTVKTEFCPGGSVKIDKALTSSFAYTYEYWDGEGWACCFGNNQLPYYFSVPSTGQLIDVRRKYTDGVTVVKTELVGTFYSPVTPVIGTTVSIPCNLNDGSITVNDHSTNHGVMPRIFQLYNSAGVLLSGPTVSASTHTFTNLSPGNYRVKIITDICSAVQSETTVSVGSAVSARIDGATSICHGTGTYLIASGGSSYKWGNGSTNSSILAAPTTVGSHTFRVTVTVGSCNVVKEHILTVNPVPVAHIQGADKACFNSNLTLTASGSGSYKWSTGASSSSITLSLLQSTQTISLTVKNTEECQSTDSKTISVLPRPSLDDAPNSICAGSTASLSVTGGSTYAWNTGDTGSSIEHSPVGSYTYRVTVTDANVCAYTLTKTVNVENPPSIRFGGETTICAGQSVNITAFGGSSYRWSENNASAGTITVSPLTTTTYTVTATSSGGCSASDQRVIQVKPSPSGNIDAPSSICPGQAVTLIATGGGTYRWSEGNATTASITVSPTQNSNYTVSITNTEGCTVVKSHTIAVNISGAASNDGPLTCTKTTATLLGTSSAQGATYRWKNASGVEIATTPGITVTTAGVYTLEITAAGGCTYTTATEVLQDRQIPQVSANSGGVLTCVQSSITLLGTSSASLASYEWRNGSGTLIANTLNASTTQTGTYTLQVTATNGCSNTASTTVTADLATPQVSVQHDGALTCTKPSATLSASSSSSGLQYTWKDAAGNPLGTASSIQVTNSGTYWLEAKGTNGCIVSQSIALTQSGTLPTVNVSLSTSGCHFTLQGSSTTAGVSYAWTNQNGRVVATTPSFTTNQASTYTLKVSMASGCSKQASITAGTSETTVSMSIDGVSQGYLSYHKTNLTCTKNSVALSASSADVIDSYLWKSPSGTYLSYSPNLTVTQAGTYLLQASTENGCPQIHEVVVERINTMPAAQISGDSTVCRYASTNLSISVPGGTYQWSNGSISSSINTGAVVNDVSFDVTVTLGSCQKIYPRTVRVEGQAPSGTGTAGPTQPCTHIPVTYSASGGSNYNWSSGETTSTIGVPNGFTSTTWVNYWVDISDQYGCSTRRSFTVKPKASPVVTVSGVPTAPFCEQAAINLTATGGGTYLWSSGETTANLQKNLSASANLQVKVTAANACAITKPINIEVVPRPTPQILGGDIACAGGSTTLSATSGSTYLWSTNATTSSISVNQPTQSQTYTVTVSSIPGCSGVVSKVVAVPAPLSLNHTLAGDNDCIANNVTVIPALSGGTGSIALGLIRSGELYVNSNLSGLRSGTYLLRAEDARGCLALDEVVIAETPPLIAHTDLSNLNDCTPNNVGLNVLASGSKLPFTYRLNGNTMSWTSANVPSGTHFIEVADAIGCIARDTIMVNETPQLQFEPELQHASCLGVADGRIAVGTVQGHGGTPPYTYAWSTGASTSEITQLAAGTYAVTVSDARGCAATLSELMITQPSQLEVDLEVTAGLSCFGRSDASLAAIASGGTAPYTYAWSTGASNTSIEGLPSGTYSVTVVDNQGCQAIAQVTVLDPPKLMLSYTLLDDTLDCLVGNVQVNLSSTGARGTVSYHFDSPQSAILTPASFSSSSLQRWVYAVDTVGCVDSVEEVVQDSISTDLINDYNLAFDRDCIDGNAAITLQLSLAGAALPLKFQLNRQTPTNLFQFDNLRAGYYRIRASYLACRDSVDVAIEERIPRITSFKYLHQDDCQPNNTGIDIKAEPGWGALYYQVGNQTPQLSSVFDSLPVGAYRFVVQDSLGCQDSLRVLINTEQPPYISIEDLVKCDSSSGRITFRPNTQGVAAEYSINGGKTWQSNTVFDTLPPGIYHPMRRKLSTGCIEALDSVVLGRNCDTLPIAYFSQKVIHLIQPTGGALIRWEAKAPQWYRDTFYLKMNMQGDGFPHFNDGSRANAQTPELRSEPPTGPNVYRYSGGGIHRDSVYLPLQDSAHLYTYPADYYFTLSTPPGGKTVVDPDRDITRVTVSLLGPETTTDEEIEVILCTDCVDIGKNDVTGANCYSWPDLGNAGQKVQKVCRSGQFTRIALDDNFKVINKTVYTVKLSTLKVFIKPQLAAPLYCSNPNESFLEAIASSEAIGEITYKWSTGETTSKISLNPSVIQYTVTVKQGDCSIQARYTLPQNNPACEIKAFFEQNGFFAIPISNVVKKPNPTLNTPEQRSACPNPTGNVKDYARYTFDVNGGNVDPESQLKAALSSFQTKFGYNNGTGIITSNDESCDCPDHLRQQLQNFSTASGLSYWYHIFKTDPTCPDAACDLLFIKAKMPDGSMYPGGAGDVAFLYAGYGFMSEVQGKTGSGLLDVVDDLHLNNFASAKTADMFEHRAPQKPGEISHLLNGVCWDGLNQKSVAVVTPSAELVMLPENSVWRFRTPKKNEFADGALTGFTKMVFDQDYISEYVPTPVGEITSAPCYIPGSFKTRGSIKAKWTEMWESRTDPSEVMLLGYFKLGADIGAYPFELPTEAEQKSTLYKGRFTYLFGGCNQGYAIESAKIPEADQNRFTSSPFGPIKKDLGSLGTLTFKQEKVYSICPADVEELSKAIGKYSPDGAVYLFPRSFGEGFTPAMIYEFFDAEHGGKSWAFVTPADNLTEKPEIWVWNCTLAIWQKISDDTKYCTVKSALTNVEELWPIFKRRVEIHTALGLASFIPVFGSGASIANGIIYIREKQKEQGVWEIVFGTVGLVFDVVGAGELIIAGRLGGAGQLVRSCYSYRLIQEIDEVNCVNWKYAVALDEYLGENTLLRLNEALADIADPTILNNINKNLKALINNLKGYSALKWINQLVSGGDAATAANIIKKALGELDFSVDEFAELVDDFTNPTHGSNFLKTIGDNIELIEAWRIANNSNLPEVLRQDKSILNSISTLSENGLFTNIGDATLGSVSNIHRYTVNGDYLNNPMRGPYTDNPLLLPDLKLPDFEYQSYLSIVEGLKKLRLTNRLETGFVYRGRTLSLSDYNILFGTGSPEDIPLKGFQSTTKDINVAKHFTALTDFPGDKVRVIMKIKSKNGVYINDISDWGAKLGPINHSDADPAIIIQEEVLLEEGYFRKLGTPQPFLENGVPKVDPDGTRWMEVTLEEMGLPIRKIEN